jgi:hypothetical protein
MPSSPPSIAGSKRWSQSTSTALTMNTITPVMANPAASEFPTLSLRRAGRNGDRTGGDLSEVQVDRFPNELFTGRGVSNKSMRALHLAGLERRLDKYAVRNGFCLQHDRHVQWWDRSAFSSLLQASLKSLSGSLPATLSTCCRSSSKDRSGAA